MNRRRALAVIGAAAGLPLWPQALAEQQLVHAWRGQALGAQARLLLAHPDERAVRRVLAQCLDEIARLEQIFSLHLPDSELVQLNRDGHLRQASHDLRRVLSESWRISAASGGAFDATVQPLWRLHAAHGTAARGPDARAIAAAQALVDYRALAFGGARVAFARVGMAATLNGIAQGYITDRVADLLRAGGFERVLVQLGETRALAPEDRPWSVGIPDPGADGLLERVALRDGALATSSGAATPLGRNGAHLLDPATGVSAQRHDSVTVQAPRAVIADGLSTALAILPIEAAPGLLRSCGGTSAHYLTSGRRIAVHG